MNRSFGGSGGTSEARAVLAFLRAESFALSIDLHEDCDASGAIVADAAREASTSPWETRRAMHCAGVRAAIAAVLEESARTPCN